MILLYTPKVSNRIQYIARFILGEICGFDYSVTTSAEEFINFKGARINYSDREMPGESLQIIPSGFLLEKVIKDFSPEVRLQEPFPILFPSDAGGQDNKLGFDLFSAAFYMLSRYEEYLPFLEDSHGRFEADQSFAFQNGFLEIPIIDLYAYFLKNKLQEIFPFITYKNRKFRFIPTYDIDVAYAFKGRGITRTMLAILKDIFTLDFYNLRERITVLTHQKPDPWDTYDLQLQLQKKHKLNPVYFFLAAEFGPKDKNISIHSRYFSLLLKKLGDYAQTGIHPSFASHIKKNRLLREIKTIAGILNTTIENSRQHYLKIHLPETYSALLKYNIQNDYSMGYASHPGFRAGTCTPFNFYNLSEETETNLKVHPLAIMDGSLRDYLKLTPDQALEKCKSIIDTIDSVDGTFISLWHNDALSEYGDWTGWRKVYTKMIEYIKEKA